MHLDPEDDYLDIAIKIYNHFEVFQSCAVTGFVHDPDLMQSYEKGKLVYDQLVKLDQMDNTKFFGDKLIRKHKRPADCIGGYTAHKQFRFKRVKLENDFKWTFWRIQ